MAQQGLHLIEADIPFAMEKPCGVDEAEVTELAVRASARRAFAAVPFVWRQTEFMTALREHVAGDTFQYLSLRIVSGHPERYVQSGNAWMLDPALAGGGSTLNLGVHLVDLYRVLVGAPDINVESARMSNVAFGLQIEDWSAMLLSAPGSECVVETGFLYPAATGTYDVRFTIKTDRHYIMTDPTTTTILDTRGGRVTRTTPAANEPTYAVFVNDVLDRHGRGEAPLAGLADMRIVMSAIARGYALAGPISGRTAAGPRGTFAAE
jgi:predicted dehydrogenase